jgi:hypothetical protein
MTDLYKAHAQLIRDLTAVVVRSKSKRLLIAWPSALAELAPHIPHQIRGSADAHDMRRLGSDVRFFGRIGISLLMEMAQDLNDIVPIQIYDIPQLKSELTRRIERAVGDLEATAVRLELSRRDKTLRLIDAPSMAGT